MFFVLFLLREEIRGKYVAYVYHMTFFLFLILMDFKSQVLLEKQHSAG